MADLSDEYSDDDFLDNFDSGRDNGIPSPLKTEIIVKQQLSINNNALPIERRDADVDVDDCGFDLDPEEQAKLDLEHEQVFSSDSAFKETDAAAEEAREEEAMEQLLATLNRSQANDTFELAQAALQSIKPEELEEQLAEQKVIESNLQASIARKQSKFNTLRKKLSASGTSTPPKVAQESKKEADLRLEQLQEENRRKKAEAKLKMIAKFESTTPVQPTLPKAPAERAQAIEWDLDDVKGWLTTVVPQVNFSTWCDIVNEYKISGQVLLQASKKGTLELYCKSYYTVSSDIQPLRTAIKKLKKDGAKQGKKTLKRMLRSTTPLTP